MFVIGADAAIVNISRTADLGPPSLRTRPGTISPRPELG